MRKINKTLIFALITASLTAYVYLFEYKKSQDKELEDQKQILSFPVDQISYFQIIKPEIRIAVQKDETGWKLNEPIFEDADSVIVNDLLSTFSDERMLAVVKLTETAFNENELAEFGLDKPIATYNFKNNSGITLKIAVGSQRNVEGQSYLHVDSGNRILLGSSLWYSKSQDQLIEYRDKRLFRGNIATIQRIKFKSLQESFELNRVDNKWISPLFKYELDQSQIREIIKKISDSAIEEYVFEGEPSVSLLKEKGIEDAPVSVEIFTDSASWLAQMNVNSKDSSLYLLSNRPTYLAKAGPLVWETIAVLTLDKLRDRTSAFVFNPEETKKIYFKNNDRETNLIFNSGTWLMGSANSPYLEVDKSEIVKTIRKIHDLRISEFIDTPDAKNKFVGQNMLILKSETEKLLLQLNWGPLYKINKNGVEVEFFYARTHLSDKIFGLERSIIDNLNLNNNQIVRKNGRIDEAKAPAPEFMTEK